MRIKCFFEDTQFPDVFKNIANLNEGTKGLSTYGAGGTIGPTLRGGYIVVSMFVLGLMHEPFYFITVRAQWHGVFILYLSTTDIMLLAGQRIKYENLIFITIEYFKLF